MHAFVVDPSRTARRVHRRFLESLGWEVTEIAPPSPLPCRADLVLTVWDPAFVASVREQYPSTRIVVVTRETSLAAMSQGLQSGADDWLVKPVHFQTLASRLAQRAA